MPDSPPASLPESPAESTGEAGLKRELGLRDLTLFAIACIVGVRWVPMAAHAGAGTVTLWLIAAVFFVAPLAVTVGTLSAKYPGAGGLYYWTRGDFGPWHGFLCFWIYWLGLAFWFPTAAMFYMSVGAYTLGPSLRAPGRQSRISDHRVAAGDLDRSGDQYRRHEDRQMDRESGRRRDLGVVRDLRHAGGRRVGEARIGDAAAFDLRHRTQMELGHAQPGRGVDRVRDDRPGTGRFDGRGNSRSGTHLASSRLDCVRFRDGVLCGHDDRVAGGAGARQPSTNATASRKAPIPRRA